MAIYRPKFSFIDKLCYINRIKNFVVISYGSYFVKKRGQTQKKSVLQESKNIFLRDSSLLQMNY